MTNPFTSSQHREPGKYKKLTSYILHSPHSTDANVMKVLFIMWSQSAANLCATVYSIYIAGCIPDPCGRLNSSVSFLPDCSDLLSLLLATYFIHNVQANFRSGAHLHISEIKISACRVSFPLPADTNKTETLQPCQRLCGFVLVLVQC